LKLSSVNARSSCMVCLIIVVFTSKTKSMGRDPIGCNRWERQVCLVQVAYR
jgi:hypothetical protein